ncbi:hypothetical protein Pint_14115 [Pistacia integerrima]|uniref:Uncharacterized protein n=1 Tax=Pistacia integerrima TaxID=434235 RepID=A0ACC0Y9U3_9ROSI|nr:hypothetical protein Pint_14115 [Pistacia integerrima]
MRSKIIISEKNKEIKPISVLQGDENFLNKILSRNSSIGNSFAVSLYYPKTIGEVPFKWETMPGTPRNPNTNEEIISESSEPVKPPPAIESSGLPEPSFNLKQEISCQPKSCFWRKSPKKKKKKIHQVDSNS